MLCFFCLIRLEQIRDRLHCNRLEDTSLSLSWHGSVSSCDIQHGRICNNNHCLVVQTSCLRIHSPFLASSHSLRSIRAGSSPLLPLRSIRAGSYPLLPLRSIRAGSYPLLPLRSIRAGSSPLLRLNNVNLETTKDRRRTYSSTSTRRPVVTLSISVLMKLFSF